MNKRLIAVLMTLILIFVMSVGLAGCGEDEYVPYNDSYLSFELSPDEILFSQNSANPNIELVLDNELLTEVFGEQVTSFAYKLAKRIRIHFSDNKKIEIEPREQTVKVTKDDNGVRIKIYIDDKEVFKKVNMLIRFDTACSIKIFFDPGSFEVNGADSDAITFMLKCESKPVSDVQQAYIRASYEGNALKFNMVDPNGEDLFFTVSGNTKDELTVVNEQKEKFTFNRNKVTTELFRTAILNPSESFAEDGTIHVYVPDGFFVCAHGNRIQVLGFKNSGTAFRLLDSEDVMTTNAKPVQNESGEQVLNLTSSDGVVATANFEQVFEDVSGNVIRNLTDVEVVIPTDSRWEEPIFSGRIISSSESYEISSDITVAEKSDVLNGYVVYISLEDAHTSEFGGTTLNGILTEESDTYDVELIAMDSSGNVVANISAPLVK